MGAYQFVEPQGHANLEQVRQPDDFEHGPSPWMFGLCVQFHAWEPLVELIVETWNDQAPDQRAQERVYLGPAHVRELIAQLEVCLSRFEQRDG